MQPVIGRYGEFIKAGGSIDKRQHFAETAHIAHKALRVPGFEKPAQALVGNACDIRAPTCQALLDGNGQANSDPAPQPGGKFS